MPDSENLWNRPHRSLIPNRPGDSTPEPLFGAVGRSITAWENLSAKIVELFCVLSANTTQENISASPKDPISDIVDKRIKSIESAISKRHCLIDRKKLHEFEAISSEIQREMLAYKGWSQRRNDIAHGTVTAAAAAAAAPDYHKIGQPITTTYSLLPSHRKDSKWLDGEPEYNYKANEIEIFSYNFSELEHRISLLVERLKNLIG